MQVCAPGLSINSTPRVMCEPALNSLKLCLVETAQQPDAVSCVCNASAVKYCHIMRASCCERTLTTSCLPHYVTADIARHGSSCNACLLRCLLLCPVAQVLFMIRLTRMAPQ